MSPFNGGRFRTRQDLIDQAIIVKLDSIPEEACNPEVGILAEFEAVRSEVLDAPLLAVSGAVCPCSRKWDGESLMSVYELCARSESWT